MPPSPLVSVVGTGLQYPQHKLGPEFVPKIVTNCYEDNVALLKLIEINERTKIENRYSILPTDYPIWLQDYILTNSECDSMFKQYGIPLATLAATQAIADWGGNAMDITHVVAMTCTSTSSPGFDCTLCQELGLAKHVRRTLVNGVTCAGSVAMLRTAYDLLLGATQQGKPARALVVAAETQTVYIKGWLDTVARDSIPNLAPTLFGDGAGALVLSNGIGVKESEREAIWNIQGAQSTLLDEAGNIGIQCTPTGIMPIISKQVPRLVQAALPPSFGNLISNCPSLRLEESNFDPTTYDWALHPGGQAILTAAENALGLSADDHLQMSYKCYRNAGNTSSVTVLSILHQLARGYREGSPGRSKVIAAAFGADITVEIMVLTKPSCGSVH
ncbi:chalcone synthase [Aspergillus nomiae NRRL 13137]|uniref:Chalcone synthase n=1 Tax=Aspergillus nomiae NRRL (strain ATCC 15546 / NRRL 13137 / CBS 260.88 / M93) TaxID=1509407 RepID=A0A0L1J3G7_ASPN3|nr:chalcone synthase [Aspergillus nomiae NRRL 13137]KNG86287.1 chalcone synthase [Aspergillus nomiae NRRL 13137]